MLDSPTDLLRKIRLGEDSYLELKEVVFAGKRVKGPGRSQLADELAAFANADGGVLILGVSDKTRQVVGIPPSLLDAVEAFVSEVAHDSIEPPVLPVVEKVELPDDGERAGGLVLKVQVHKGLFVHRSPGGYLLRAGSHKRQMSTAYLARLLEQRTPPHRGRFDRQVVTDVSLDDFDPRLVDRFRGSIADEDRITMLRKLDMVREDETGQLRPTVAGVLVGTRTPQEWLPQAFIQSVAYRGTNVVDALDAERYQLDAKDNDGPLDEQIAYACRFVARNQRIEASKTLGREDFPQYDLTAVFEAIVNAVAHRDYAIRGSKIRLKMFTDRIELYSPGALVNAMTIDDLPYKQNTRNLAITNLLDRCPIPDQIETPRLTLMDRRGEGVPAILTRSRGLSGKQPIYEVFGEELRLTIFAAGRGDPA